MDAENPVYYPGWQTVQRLGTGSFGSVYEIEREMFGRVEKAALKVISVPKDPGEAEELYSAGYDTQSVYEYYQNLLANIVQEYQIMAGMKGHSNVVSCEDIQYYPKENGIGWTICIKMELLTPMLRAMEWLENEEQICKFGEDLCKALVLCHSRSVIHRDIKPQNIFISTDGDFKLGDFGIAKITDQVSRGTRIGTMNYMAPEIYCDLPYGHTADIYSLGLVMYWLLNERRLPLVALPPAKPTSLEIQEACLSRLHGCALPPPANGSPALHRIILKACAYNPNERYASAQEMLQDLQNLRSVWFDPLPPVQAAAPNSRLGETVVLSRAPVAGETTVLRPEDVYPYLTPPPYDGQQSGAEPVKLAGRETEPEPKPKRRSALAFKNAALAFLVTAVVLAAIVLIIEKPWVTQESMMPRIAAGEYTIVGLNSDGTTVAVGLNMDGQCDVSDWKDIIDIAAGGAHTVGLRANGTVVSVGRNDYGQCEVSDWKRITAIAVGMNHTVGLCSDGTVQAVGKNSDGQCDVSAWRDIVAIAAGADNTIGLRANGSVVVAGEVQTYNKTVAGWTGIKQIKVGMYHIVGLREDGTVAAVGRNSFGQCKVGDWSDITELAVGLNHTVGLRGDGTVVAAGQNTYGQCDVGDWTYIVDVAAGVHHTVGLRADGTVVIAGYTKVNTGSVDKMDLGACATWDLSP